TARASRRTQRSRTTSTATCRSTPSSRTTQPPQRSSRTLGRSSRRGRRRPTTHTRGGTEAADGRRKTRMNALGRLLPSLLRGAEDSPHARECAAFTAWNGAVGAAVRRASAPVRLEGRFLIVAAVDQTWKTQLERLAQQLIFKVNSLLGAPLVTRIVFRVD